MKLETLLIHGGLEAGTHGESTVPLSQSSGFAHRTAEEMADVFRGKRPGFLYTRIQNPTTEAFEKRLALLEGGIGAIATASGMAAISAAVLTIAGAGDEILASSSLFGGTYSLFKETLPNFGVAVRFFDPADLSSLEAGISDKTRLVFIETIGNPKMDVPDIAAAGAIAKAAGIPLVADSTLTTPCLVRPKEFGADIVVHSTSKFINGTGSAIGGALVDCGTFGWDNPRFPHFRPYLDRYADFAFLSRARRLILKDLGGCAAPFNSFISALGLETLALRMERHCENAERLAGFLELHPDVEWVNYPGLAGSPFYRLANEQFGGKAGAVFTFGLGNRERAFSFINRLVLAKNVPNLGDAKTLVIHPASTIYCDFSPGERRFLGVTDDMVRVSAGIEAIEDLYKDFEQALRRTGGGK